MRLSILICTLEARQESFKRIYNKLIDQIKAAGLEKEIEIKFFRDNRVYKIGHKRNELLHKAEGDYVMFVDDDDDVSNNFIELIYGATRTKPDCVSLTGIITHDGKNPKRFEHSIKYKEYSEVNGVYLRPPNHLNPIKREIATQFTLPHENHGEDTNWSMKILDSGLIKTEVEINVPYYYYLFDPYKVG